MDIRPIRRRPAGFKVDSKRDFASPAPLELRPDPEVRRRLSGPALRTFFNIAAAWRLTVQEQRALLGWTAASSFHKY
jgi:hypothetical protein